MRFLEILKAKARAQAQAPVARVPAINFATNAKDMVRIERTVTSANVFYVLAVGEHKYLTRSRRRLRGLFRMRRPTIVPPRRSRQSWRPRQLLLSRTPYTRTTKTLHGSVLYERMLSFPRSAIMGGMPVYWRTPSAHHHITAQSGQSVYATIDIQVLYHLLARQVSM